MTYARVHRWIAKDRKITYEFGKGKDIPLPIFVDDTVEKALSKIAVGINTYHQGRNEDHLVPSLLHVPYAWSKRRALRFNIKGDAKKQDESMTFPVNPWDADVNALSKQNWRVFRVVYKDSDLIDTTEIHMVFASDAPQFEAFPVYFPDADAKWKVPSFDVLVAENALMEKVWGEGNGSTREKNVSITHANFSGVSKQFVHISSLFQAITTSAAVPFLQLVEDEHKIVYKIYTNHSISHEQLESWTSFDRIPKISSLVAMIATNRKGVFARLTIHRDGGMHIQYHMESRENMTWHMIQEHVLKVKELIAKWVHGSVHFKPNDVSMKTEIHVRNTSVQTFSKYVGKLISVFHVHKIMDGILEVSCKRSKNYKQRLDIADYIASRIKVGIPVPQIMTDLIDLGLSREDVVIWLSQYQSASEVDAPRKKTIASTGCLLRISKSSTGLRVHIDHASSFDEALRIRQWLNGVARVNALHTETVPQDNIAGPSRPPASKSKSKSVTKSPSPKGNLNDDSFEIESSGGALGKQYQRYFNTQLNEADPAIFVETKDYSRQCAANNFRQPVVISKEEKEKLDETGYKDSVDNSVAYGSDAQHQNHYMCPRIWCPVSRVPLTQEQLDANGGKCPAPHSEEPILLYNDKYWDMNSKTPHYIGFLSNKSPKGLCLPCCMKKPLKPSKLQQCKGTTTQEPAASVAENRTEGQRNEGQYDEGQCDEGQRDEDQQREEMYIIGAPAPITTNRYGIIPKALHHLFMPSVAFASCSKTISTMSCYVRHGVGVDDDSFMRSLAVALQLHDKHALLQYIQKRLDPLTFISLENGHVLKAFAEINAIIPSQDAQLLNEWRKWAQQYPSYKKYINADKWKENEDALSRELGIYKAYRNFLHHLRSKDPKNPQHLIDFFFRQGILLLIWKKHGQQATLLCPYFRDIATLIRMKEDARHVIMLLQDGDYFEPIEMKRRGSTGVTLHPYDRVAPAIKPIISACPSPLHSDTSFDILQKLRALSAWIPSSLQNHKHFVMKTVLIRPDFTIYALQTSCNALIMLPKSTPIAILPELLHDFAIQRVVHQEDVQDTIATIQGAFVSDMRLLILKLQQFGFGVNFGMEIPSESSYIYNAKITIPHVAPTIVPVIRVNAQDDFGSQLAKQKKIDQRWKQIQMLIGRTFVTYYDTLVVPVLSRPRNAQIEILLRTFPSIPARDKPMFQQAMEEMPFAEGKDSLEQWMRSVNFYLDGVFLSSSVQRQGKEWVFSQSAIDNGMPWVRLMPKNGPVPSAAFTPTDTLMYQGTRETAILPPCIFEKQYIEHQTLPSKFRNHSWNTFTIWKTKPRVPLDCQQTLSSLLAWLSKELHVPCSSHDVHLIKTMLIAKLLQSKENEIMLEEDPSYLSAWSNATGKKLKKAGEVWTKVLATMTYEHRRNVWMEQVATSTDLKTSDIDWYIVASLLSVNIILLLHRGKHGAVEQMKDEYKRGNIADLSLSSYFFASGKEWRSSPCIILYKDVTETESVYSIVADKDDRVIHIRTDKMPNDILQLIELHVAKRSSQFEQM